MQLENEQQQKSLAIGASRSALATYAVIVRAIRWVLNPYLRVKAIGQVENLSIDGPLILAPVHRSHLDSLVVASLSKRRCRAIAKHTLFTNKAFAWLLSALGAIPIERGAADRDALKAARMLLDDEQAMIIFPEGTRSSGLEVEEVFGGVAYMAAKSNATVVPIAIVGTAEALPKSAKFIRRSNVVVNVGPLMTIEANEKGRASLKARKRFGELLTDDLNELMAEADRYQNELQN